MEWYMLLICYGVAVKATLLSSSFTIIFQVSLSKYDSDILEVTSGVCSQMGCASKCGTDCYSYTYNQAAKECTTYRKDFCGIDGGERSSDIQMFVRKRLNPIVPSSCSELSPACPSGVYQVALIPNQRYDVYCDMETNGGPWTVIQNRQDGKGDFYRNWDDYKTGFGNLSGNFWAGLDIIHLLTQTGLTLRIELTTWFNDTAYAQYSYFKVGDESSKWRLSISGNSGNVNYDAMARSNGELFSTYDNDNDSWGDNCAQNRHGAWWYNWCGRCNLNGEYTKDNGDDKASMSWFRFYSGRYFVPFMKSRIMVKHQGV